MTKQYVAVIEKHDGGPRNAVMVPHGQSLDFDEGPGATRRWLWPHLGTDFHLVEFLEVTTVEPPAERFAKFCHLHGMYETVGGSHCPICVPVNR